MKTININGIDYVKKAELDELKVKVEKDYVKRADLEKIKSMMFKIAGLIETKPESERKPKKSLKDSRIFVPSKTSRRDINVVGITKDGHFVKNTGHKTSFTLKDVKYLKGKMNSKTTFGDMRRYARELQISPESCRIMGYNIRQGAFEKYL